MVDRIDVMLYMMPPQTFTARQHLAAEAHPIFQYWRPGEIWHIKGKRGFPWDGNTYDEQYVYQVYTEGPKGWDDPSSFKRFVSKSWPNGSGGIAWCPRYLNIGRAATDAQPFPEFLVTDDSTYETWEDGKKINTQSLGPVLCQMSGPYLLQCGKLGQQECLVQSYQWDTNFKHMEVNWYALGLGWVRWQLWRNEGGLYKLVQETLFDQLTEGGTPELVIKQ